MRVPLLPLFSAATDFIKPTIFALTWSANGRDDFTTGRGVEMSTFPARSCLH